MIPINIVFLLSYFYICLMFGRSTLITAATIPPKRISKEKSHVFFPNLDGLRFFCFLSVFFFHSFVSNYSNITSSRVYIFIKSVLFANGNLGVNFFFVLSGFLITFLLLKEKEVTGKIHITNFYIRRFLRIWPLYYLCVFIGFIIFPMFGSTLGQLPGLNARPLYYIFFINNFDLIRHLNNNPQLFILWSIAVEEQFYLVWPVLFAFTPSKYYKYLFISVILFSFVYRCFNYNQLFTLSLSTFSCISDMAVGGMAAYLISSSNWLSSKIKKLSRFYIVLIYVVAALIYIFDRYTLRSSLYAPFERLVVSVVFALIILEQCFSDNSFYKMGKYKLISKLGKYTYGLYCLHIIGIYFTRAVLRKFDFDSQLWQVLIVEGGLSLILSIGLAYISYTLFESNFLKLKERFSFIVR